MSIDERRAKFRQDLIYQGVKKEHKTHRHLREIAHEKYRARRGAVSVPAASSKPDRGRRQTLAPLDEHVFRPHSTSRSRASRRSIDGTSQTRRGKAENSQITDSDGESDDDEQDIDEIWYVFVGSASC